MKGIPILIVVLLLAQGCVRTQEFRGPSGRLAYSMQCGNSINRCYEKAGEICPNGYTIIDRSTGTGAALYRGIAMATPQQSLAIECHNAL
jgi:hypothetical protein